MKTWRELARESVGGTCCTSICEERGEYEVENDEHSRPEDGGFVDVQRAFCLQVTGYIFQELLFSRFAACEPLAASLGSHAVRSVLWHSCTAFRVQEASNEAEGDCVCGVDCGDHRLFRAAGTHGWDLRP